MCFHHVFPGSAGRRTRACSAALAIAFACPSCPLGGVPCLQIRFGYPLAKDENVNVTIRPPWCVICSDGIVSCSFRSGLARLSLACNSFEGFSQKGKMALTTGLAAKLGFMRVKESSNLSTTWLKVKIVL